MNKSERSSGLCVSLCYVLAHIWMREAHTMEDGRRALRVVHLIKLNILDVDETTDGRHVTICMSTVCGHAIFGSVTRVQDDKKFN